MKTKSKETHAISLAECTFVFPETKKSKERRIKVMLLKDIKKKYVLSVEDEMNHVVIYDIIKKNVLPLFEKVIKRGEKNVALRYSAEATWDILMRALALGTLKDDGELDRIQNDKFSVSAESVKIGKAFSKIVRKVIDFDVL